MALAFNGKGGGGSSPVIKRQIYYDVTGISIADGAAGRLHFNNNNGPDTLLDVTDPANPTVISSGVYAVAVEAGPGVNLTAGGSFAVTLQLDPLNESPRLNQDVVATAGFPAPVASVAMTYYLPAGVSLYVEVGNRDGVAARTFYLNQAIIQKLS